MAALLWKEWRENLYKVGVGLGICLLLLLLRLWYKFNSAFTDVVQVWAGVIGCLTAGVLAMDAVAGERTRGTLDFLLARPTTPLRILLPKFAVGAGGLLVVVAGFWLTVYGVPFPGGEDGTLANWAVADVPWLAMVFTWYVPLLAVYALIFFASVATENPAEAAATGCIMGLASLYGYFTLSELVPEVEAWRIPQLMLDLGMGSTGNVVRMANTASVQALRVAVAGAVVVAAFGASLALLARHRQFSIQRRTIVVAGFALVALGLILPPLFPEDHVSVVPMAEVPLGAKGRGLLRLPWAPAGTFAAIHADGLQMFSYGPGGEGALVQRGEVRLDGGGVQWGAATAGRVWLAREPGGREQTLEIIGVAVEDPDAPHVLAHTVVSEPGSIGRIAALEPLGDRLLLASWGEDGVLVAALEPQPDGTVRKLSILPVPDDKPTVSGPWIVAPDSWQAYGIAVANGHVYLGLSSELVTVDARGPGHLREASRMRLEASNRVRPHGPRHVAVHGDRLHVARHWPKELVVMNLSEPGSPRPIDTEYCRSPLMKARSVDGLLYVSRSYHYWRAGIEVHDPADLAARPVPVFHMEVPGEDAKWMSGAPLVIDGHLLATMGDRLAVFALPERLRQAAAAAVHAGP